MPGKRKPGCDTGFEQADLKSLQTEHPASIPKVTAFGFEIFKVGRFSEVA